MKYILNLKRDLNLPKSNAQSTKLDTSLFALDIILQLIESFAACLLQAQHVLKYIKLNSLVGTTTETPQLNNESQVCTTLSTPLQFLLTSKAL